MKKIMSQGENGSFLFGLTSANEKPRRSLSAKLNDKNTSYFRITWATVLDLFYSPYSRVLSRASFPYPRCPVFNKRSRRRVPSVRARYFRTRSVCYDVASFLFTPNYTEISQDSQNSVLRAMFAGFAKEDFENVRFVLYWGKFINSLVQRGVP